MTFLRFEAVPPSLLSGVLMVLGALCFIVVAESFNPILRPRTVVARRRHFHGSVALFAFCLAACAMIALAPRAIGLQLLIAVAALAIGLAVGVRLIGLRYPGVQRAPKRSYAAEAGPASSALVPAAPAPSAAFFAQRPVSRPVRPGSGSMPAVVAAPVPVREPPSVSAGSSGREPASAPTSKPAHRSGSDDMDHDMTIAEAEFFDSDDTLSIPDVAEPEADPERSSTVRRRGVAVGGRPGARPSPRASARTEALPSEGEQEHVLKDLREELDACQRDLKRAELRRMELVLRVRGQDVAIEEMREQTDRYKEIARNALDKAMRAVKAQRDLRKRLEEERGARARAVSSASRVARTSS